MASVPNALRATAYTWDAGAAFDYWQDPVNWVGDVGFPNSNVDTIVALSANIILANDLGVDSSFTVKSMITNDANASVVYANVAGGTGRIIMESDTGTAAISAVKNSGGVRKTRYDVGITLNSNIVISSLGSIPIEFTKNITSGINPSTLLPYTTNVTLGGSPAGSGSGSQYTLFSAAATYTGNTIFAANLSTSLGSGNGGGKLQIGGNNFAPTNSVFIFNAGTITGSNAIRNQGGYFNLGGFNQEVAGLEATAGTAVGMVTNIGSALSTLTINASSNHVFNGIISDSHTAAIGTTALAKLGIGTETLATAVNAYSGGTTVSGGVLLLSSGYAGAATHTGTTTAGAPGVVLDSVAGLFIGQRVTSASANIPVGARIIGIVAATNTVILSSTSAAAESGITINFAEASSLGIDNALGTGGNVLINGGTLASSVVSMWSPGNLTLTSGHLDPNQTSAGNFTLNTNKSFTMSGGIWDLNLGTQYDQILATGTGTFNISGGSFALDVSGAGFSYDLTYQVLSGFSGGSVTNLAFTGYDSANYQADLSNTGTLTFVAVPEAQGTVLLLLGGFVFFLRRRKPGLGV